VTPTVSVLVLLGAVLVVPLGLPLLATPGLQRLRWPWPVAGAVAGTSLLLAPSPVAAALTLPYLALAVVAATLGLRRTWGARCTARRLRSSLRELTALTATASLPVAALSWTSERAGHDLLGFDGTVLALTVAHFHYAGFAVALLAGLVLVRVPGRLPALGAAAVPTGTALVAVGHFLGPAVELAGACVLTAGLLTVSVVVLRSVVARGAARRLLLVSALTTPLTMALALWWAVGRLTGLPHPDLAVMAATHGAANAVGVCLCGLLGWRVLRPVRL
jgi:hypothetical protein